MKILQINTVYRIGSTGKIVLGIENQCDKFNIDHYVGYRYIDRNHTASNNEFAISTWLDCHIHNRISTMTGLQGFFSYFRTRKFIRTINIISPDVIHLHNIHGSYINHYLLAKYLKKCNKPVIWTLHDCWSFTGLCPYFTESKCEKWKEECGHCILCQTTGIKIDLTRFLIKKKRKWFSGIPNMRIITPSNWLKCLAEESYLSQYPINVINNGIDVTVFHPRVRKYKDIWNARNKFVILGVAFDWGHRKGLDIFTKLARYLSDEYLIVLVGTNKEIDMALPSNIISIHKTNNQDELAEIYSSADIFFNPTREDNYPTVNLEALACGTPVLTFNTGGSAEMIDDTCGSVVLDDIDSIYKELERIRVYKPYNYSSIIQKANSFDQNIKFKEYVDLYLNLCGEVHK